jgi:hypothetical protein
MNAAEQTFFEVASLFGQVIDILRIGVKQRHDLSTGSVDSPLLPVDFGQYLSQPKPALELLRDPLPQIIILTAKWTI